VVGDVDVVIGNEEDFTACLGLQVPGTSSALDTLEVSNFKSMIAQVSRTYENVRVIATTLRTVHTASINGWGAVAWANGEFVESQYRERLEVFDRIGGGDSFASGLLYGLLNAMSLQDAVDYGAAHGALAMTTPAATSMATLSEVERLVRGGNARVQR
jgi:2-dehydro-3-deoxygluconokinase